MQISLPSSILDPDIASNYPRREEVRPRYQSSNASLIPSNDNASNSEKDNTEDSSGDGKDDGSGSDEESDTESISSGSELSESPAVTEILHEEARLRIDPTDIDGSNLTFKINTAFLGPRDQVMTNAANLPNKHQIQQSVGNTESLNITKAVSTEAEGRTTLQVHVLPGPRNTATNPDVSVRWFHLHSERQDFTRFKETCLGISGLSERLHKITRRLFEKVEKDKLKVFLGGMFIEPGTVLRADESHQPDPQSAIFSCIPYFELQTPTKSIPIAGQTNRFLIRTLMQSYYPYEPVHDRDAEQAYRKFGNEQRNALVHVPNIWMVNIGSDIVVTCGQKALSNDFVQSIEVVEVNRGHTKKEKSRTTNIRLTDWDGRHLFYTLEECQSYFQIEQKLRELLLCSGHSRYDKSLQLLWKTPSGNVKVSPELWAGILKQRDGLFTDLAMADDTKKDDKHEAVLKLPLSTALSPSPFFNWPQTTGTNEQNTEGFISDEITRSLQCLGYVEKAILSEVLSGYGPYSAVEKTFTSTTYYRTLSEEIAEHVMSGIKSLLATGEKSKHPTTTGLPVHQATIIRQQNGIAQKTSELYEVMHKTLALFVNDVDKSAMLRKSWGAMKSIYFIAATICRCEPLDADANQQFDTDEQYRSTDGRGWFVRPDINGTETSAPLKKLKRTLEKCKKCRRMEAHATSQAASVHLQKHLKRVDLSESDASIAEQWTASYAQMKMETWNGGFLAILTNACHTAQRLYLQAKELSDGVRNENGHMSDLYMFPRPLLSAFRQLLVFYFAVERAMYYTEESFKDERNAFEEPDYLIGLPFSTSGLEVLDTFGNGVQQAIFAARDDLCSMTKSTGPLEVFKRLSLSPEYVCSWFMRRLIVKPLEKSMTVSDMYREYLSTVVSTPSPAS